MNMDIKKDIESQYLASLAMLRELVAQCPPELWHIPGAKRQFWHIAYHALFFTHLYLHQSGSDFKAWAKFRENYEFLGPFPWNPNERPVISEPYTRADLLEFCDFCQDEVIQKIASLKFTKKSGFDWLPFSKLELQIYNLRHLQQHIGELSGWLGDQTGIEFHWIPMKPEEQAGV
jgi:hypothetical protein